MEMRYQKAQFGQKNWSWHVNKENFTKTIALQGESYVIAIHGKMQQKSVLFVPSEPRKRRKKKFLVENR